MNVFEYREPESLEEALSLLDQYGEEAKVIAGGTALVIMLNQRLLMPGYLISLRRLPDLRQLESANDDLSLGALATHRELEISPLLRAQIPALAETYRRVATIRIRNMATVGGNLAHADPNQDPPVTLLALDARVRIASSSGSREVSLAEFFTDYYETVLEPHELLTEVLVPLPTPDTATVYLKFLPRTAEDYATVGVAASVQVDPATGQCRKARIALGSLGPTPLRVPEAETLLRDQRLTPELLLEAGELAEKITDPVTDARGSASYKRAMASVFLRRAVKQAWEKALGDSLPPQNTT